MGTILVVEDEDSTARMFQLLLERFGYQVVHAINGSVALTRLAETPVDLVLSDVMLPTMSGLALCCQMRANERYRAIPLIFISAVGESRVAGLCAYQAFLQKPVHIDRLLSTIDAVMTAARP